MSRARQLVYRAQYIGIIGVLAFGVLVSTLVMARSVSADALSERSIELSTSTKGAHDVTYTVNFTAAQAAGAFVVDFCSDSPVIGDGCTPPAGFVATGATSSSQGVTDVDAVSASQVIVSRTIAIDDEVSVELEGITNPSEAGPLYARIVSYDTKEHAEGYTSNVNPGIGAVDQGSVALAITDAINVSGRVLESMTFCVASDVIGKNCQGAGGNPPILKLGEEVGDAIALQADAVSTGDIYTQLSTNASGGAVISLKSDAKGCGGLLRSGAPNACDIAPALKSDIEAGEAKFGLKLAASTGTVGYDDASGVLQAVTGSGYNNSTFALNFAQDEQTGVTSVYGDRLLDTDGAPVDNQNVKITFGASIANNTPGGQYATNISLVATGRF